MRRLKIGIRTQLMVLVGFASLLSLLILGLVTGIYFSNNLRSLRSERLEVISQLKATQVSQSVGFIQITVSSLAQVERIREPLSSHQNGNESSNLFDGVESLFTQYTFTDQFASARLYDKDYKVVTETTDEYVIINEETKEKLYPIPEGGPLPAVVDHYTNINNTFYYTGPLPNNTGQTEDPYFVGLTVAIYDQNATDTIIGYLSVISSASSISSALNSTSNDYWTTAVKPVYSDNTTDYVENRTADSLIGFASVFPNNGAYIQPDILYNVNSSSLVGPAFNSNSSSGIKRNIKSVTGVKVSTAYYKVRFGNWEWLIVTSQKQSSFNAPVTKMTHIIIGVTIGVGFFMCAVTFTLAVWFIRPITRLKEATESITRYRKGKKGAKKTSNNGGESPPSSSDTLNDEKLSNRDSVHSMSTNGSENVHSSGIRLPSRIPRSKMMFKDELTELSEAFNIMTEELEKQYMHLEDRVKLRTKELEASKIEAEAANEAKTVFIANISHELRTPLNGILGMSSIAMEEDDQDRLKDSLKLIYRSGELLLHILTELLTYSKNTLNRSKLEKSNFQILEIVYQIHSIFTKLALDQRVKFKMQVKPQIFRKLILYGDSNRIIQIIMNLVSNALKFTPVDGSVSVSFKMIGEYDYERSKKENFEHVYILDDKAEATSTSRRSSKGRTNLMSPITRPASPVSPVSPVSPQQKAPVLSPVFEFDKSKDYFSEKPAATISPTNTDVAPGQTDPPNHEALSEKEQVPTNITTNNEINDTNDNEQTPNTDVSDDDKHSIITLATVQYEHKIHESQFHNKPLPMTPNISPGNSLERIPTRTSRTPSVTTVNYDQAYKSNPMSSPSEYKAYPALDKRTEFDANMSNHEVVKENKAFKIRKMYKPKTWVVQIKVTDTGSGIEPALQEKVFEPFVQGDQTLSRSYGGTGLGLSICRQLSKMMRGSLTLDSKIGEGSCFTLTLPLPQTGEIVVPPQDLEMFCDDEFNPMSKSNRRVVFDENAVVVSAVGDKDTSNNSNSTSSGSTHGDGTYSLAERSDASISTNPTHDESSQGHADGDDEEQNSSVSPLNAKPLKRSVVTLKSKNNLLNIYAEKPELLHHGSTGTANSGMSVNPSDKDNHLDHEDDKCNPHDKHESRDGINNGDIKANGKNHSQQHIHHSDFESVTDNITPLKILIAEDNKVNQEVIKRMMKLEGFTNLTMACNGAEAIEFVKLANEANDPFALIFMDVQMPKIDGLSATKLIRQELHYERPIIALTAFADESNVRECFNCGMNGFLSKPIKRNNLQRIFREFGSLLLEDAKRNEGEHDGEKKN
ncbi:SLN1 [Candida theae]|uniref:histidine kinase n=1 Tax=Candida theae TaxID=1198502 RepID=A0AAD5B9M3_9ASCO|nr:SLN1 [Candida theae]KAI5948680.1 SLN1 [Candida theae]